MIFRKVLPYMSWNDRGNFLAVKKLSLIVTKPSYDDLEQKTKSCIQFQRCATQKTRREALLVTDPLCDKSTTRQPTTLYCNNFSTYKEHDRLCTLGLVKKKMERKADEMCYFFSLYISFLLPGVGSNYSLFAWQISSKLISSFKLLSPISTFPY